MAAAHQRAIQWNDIEQRAEAEFLAQKPAHHAQHGEAQSGVEKEFAGVVARLTMNVNCTGIVRGLCIIKPEVVNEMGVGLGQGDKITTAWVIKPDLGPLVAGQHAGHAGQRSDQCSNFSRNSRITNGDVGQLMVNHGKGLAAKRVKDVAKWAAAGVQKTSLAQGLIDCHRATDIAVAVFADDPDSGTDAAGGFQQWCHGHVKLGNEPGHIAAGRAAALGFVIKMRQIDKCQVWAIFAQHLRSGHADPVCGRQASPGAPEIVERKGAQHGFKVFSEAVGRAQNAERLVAVGSVIRLGGDAESDIGTLVKPPEEVGGAKFAALLGEPGFKNIIESGQGEEVAALLPEANFARFAEIPAIADDAMFLRQLAGKHGGLSGKGDCGQNFVQTFHPARFGQGLKLRGVGQQASGKADRVDKYQRCRLVLVAHVFSLAVARRRLLMSREFPPYSYVPGGPWPHPKSNPAGHSFGRPEMVPGPGELLESALFQEGADLFNNGFYWEAHEAWETLWHAAGRKGPVADFLKALIKLAAAGVKVREGSLAGVRTHAGRAAVILGRLVQGKHPELSWFQLELLLTESEKLANEPFILPEENRNQAVMNAFSIELVKNPKKA